MGCDYGNPCDYCKGENCSAYITPDAEKIVCYCYRCDEAICEGDDYYIIGGEPYCEECVEKARRRA